MSKSPSSDTAIITTKHEGSINFRPSPNFKHMKKYLKSKFEEDMNSATALVLDQNGEHNKINVTVQPPLPPNSPPPDSPTSFTLKTEIEDDDYENSSSVSNDLQNEGFTTTLPQEESDKKKPIMCKDFVRKKCTRGAACKYAHEIDLSQLRGVFKFCRDFANGCCNRAVCNFTHATTFEKEHFYRTAFLPAHCLAHIKPQESNGTSDTMFNNPPPQPHASTGAAPVSVVLPPTIAEVCAAAPGMPTGPTVSTVSSVVQKREWRDTEEFSSPPRDLDASEPLAKKCKHCELTEIRFQHNKAQLAQAMRSSQELDDKIESIVKKNLRLNNILRALLTPRAQRMEHVSNSLLTTNSLSVIGEERNKDLMSQMKLMLAKMLLKSGERGSPDVDPST